MELKLICVGKTKFDFIKEGINFYTKRIETFVKFKFIELNIPKKSANKDYIKIKESQILSKEFGKCDAVILFDEKGKELTSMEFAKFIENQIVNSIKNLCFVIGGAYGFTEQMKRTYKKISLSKMTFPHDLVRLIAVEQIYRAFTIMAGKNYHH